MKKIVQIEFLNIDEDDKYSKLIESVAEECFKEEKLIDTKLYLSIILTTPKDIQEMNNTYRKINKETDVLSFPMFEKEELENANFNEVEEPLGDIVISVDKVLEQAQEYGHSIEREFAFLICHSMLHLFGYDHMEDDERTEMETQQRIIMEKLNILR